MNNTNNFGKRTANQVNAILREIGIDAKSENLGDGRTFDIKIADTIKNRFLLKKKGGFILMDGKDGNNYITVKCY